MEDSHEGRGWAFIGTLLFRASVVALIFGLGVMTGVIHLSKTGSVDHRNNPPGGHFDEKRRNDPAQMKLDFDPKKDQNRREPKGN